VKILSAPRGKWSTLALLAGLALLSSVAGCKSGGQKAGGSAESAGAPPESSFVLANLDGTTATLDQYKGKVVLVNFWATWCQPCQTEIPWLIEFNEKYGPKGLVILGVSMDEEGKKVVEPFVKNQRFTVAGHPEPMNYQIVLGDDKAADKFGGLIGLPTSMLYSRDGKKIKTIVGLINYDDLSKTLQSQL
jgi:cytochrome c biogenesis protein CcmG, thiol:disulfide interchange protein DsbE